MIDALKSELRKLLTVRSTYVIILICLGIIALFAGYGDGVKASQETLKSPELLVRESYSALLFAGLIASIAALLLVGHEYRYNMIMYTLTSSRNRLTSLAAKAIVISLFALTLSLVFTFFSPLCALIGVHLSGHTLVPQIFDVWQVLWRCLFVGWGYTMLAFILAVIIRSQVGAIVAFLLIPLVGENILANVFRGSSHYLPFMSLQSVIPLGHESGAASLQHNIYVSLTYVIVGLAVGGILFMRRDAN